MATTLREIVYRPRQPVRGAWPGRHRGGGGGGGLEFRGHVPFSDAPDARRLDLLASLREPFGRWLVRVGRPRLALPVWVLADLSASMNQAGAAGQPTPHAVLADLVEALAWSAWKSGDAFGFVGCAEHPLPAWTLPPTRQRGAGMALAQRLRAAPPLGRSADGLREAAPGLGRRRALVFLASDFHAPLAQLDALLAALSAHEVVPVRLARPAEAAPGLPSGLLPLRDGESGHQRLVWWRPALRTRWWAEWQARQHALDALFTRYRLRSVVLDGAFDADRLNRHFMA